MIPLESVARTEPTNRAREVALERLSRLDETIARNHAEVREAVRQSGEVRSHIGSREIVNLVDESAEIDK